MSTTSVGQAAEAVAAAYLQSKGYKLKDRNWRTRWCEIDLIAAKAGRLYFIEVKYRRRPDHGHGLAYITPAKLRRMTFAAELWLSHYGYEGEWELAGLEVSGEAELKVSAWLPNLT